MAGALGLGPLAFPPRAAYVMRPLVLSFVVVFCSLGNPSKFIALLSVLESPRARGGTALTVDGALLSVSRNAARVEGRLSGACPSREDRSKPRCLLFGCMILIFTCVPLL